MIVLHNQTVKVNGKTYTRQEFNTCELCDLRGADGRCKLPHNQSCTDGDYFKLKDNED